MLIELYLILKANYKLGKHLMDLHKIKSKSDVDLYQPVIIVTTLLGLVLSYRTFFAVEKEEKKEEPPVSSKLTRNARRFMNFASIEFNENVFMSPRDYLDSVTQNHPTAFLKKRMILNKEQLNSFLKETPSVGDDSSGMFKQLSNRGIISFPEYLFLNSIITKKQEEYLLTLQILDVNYNKTINMDAFLNLHKLTKYSSIKDYSTTLIVHLFGKDRKREVSFEEFFKFRHNLQMEILEVEFMQYSLGTSKISEWDFTQMILGCSRDQNSIYQDYMDLIINTLHYDIDNTYLRKISSLDDITNKYQVYLDRMLSKIADETETKYIKFPEYVQFFRLMVYLDDFEFAVSVGLGTDEKMTEVKQKTFQRAAKVCIGEEVSKNVANAIFTIFDDSGSGSVNCKNFIAIMKVRSRRKFRKNVDDYYWIKYYKCLKHENRRSRKRTL